MSILTIEGEPGSGKSSFLAAMAVQNMYGKAARVARKNCNKFINELNACGYDLPHAPRHLVYTDFTVTFKSPDCGVRRTWAVDGNKLGFETDKFKPQYIYPYSTIILDEAQQYFYSRDFSSFPKNVSRWFEKHRKFGLNIYLAAQRDGLIELNIRSLGGAIYLYNVEFKRTLSGNVKTVWQLERWEHYRDYAGGKPGIKGTYTFDGDVRKVFNTTEGRELFVPRNNTTQFVAREPLNFALSPQGILDFVKAHPQDKSY